MNTDVPCRTHALVYIGGGPCDPALLPVVPDECLVVAADGGCDLAVAHGRRIDAVVGDMDSVSVDALAVARADGAVVETHRTDKDRTDFELALEHAARHGVRSVTVVGGAGGRLDHLLVNVAVLASPRWAHLQVDAVLGGASLHVVHGPGGREVRGGAGATVSVVAVGGPATGVSTTGLAFAMTDHVLAPDVGLGCSNVFTTGSASVRCDTGTLVVVVPHGSDGEERP